jgi:hypothetical protein
MQNEGSHLRENGTRRVDKQMHFSFDNLGLCSFPHSAFCVLHSAFELR